MRRVNPDIRHVLIGKAYAAELLLEAKRKREADARREAENVQADAWTEGP